MRERYHELMANPVRIEALLQAGADKARAAATPFMRELRQAVGLRNLGTQLAAPASIKPGKVATPAFKQYREKDGKFYFKLLDAEGHLLLQSIGFDSPKEAALLISTLQKEGRPALMAHPDQCTVSDGISEEALGAALSFFAAA